MNYYNETEILKLLVKFGTGYKCHNDSIFRDGNYLIKPFKRLGVLPAVYDEDDFIFNNKSKLNSISCNVPGCKEIFDAVSGYEHHYNSHHRFICSFCRKTEPNEHLLDLHISEKHDSYFAVQAERKPMYACFILECSHKSSNPDDRHDHCILDHSFPHNFRFEKILHKRPEKSKLSESMEVSELKPSKSSDSSTKKSPKPVKDLHFGHGGTKTFAPVKRQTRRKIKTTILEDNDNQMVIDLMESLPS